MKKRIIALFTSIAILICAAFTLGSCSKPPEYAEIEERFIELVEKSYEINKVLFGVGLPTYERVYDRTINDYEIYNGEYYYYELEDDELGKIIAYRSVSLQKDEHGKLDASFSYAQVLDAPTDGKIAIYEDAKKHIYCYSIDYQEPIYDFYYSSSDPKDYDYVKLDDSAYQSIDQIKMAAEEVYSIDYLKTSVYESLFTGVVMSEESNSSGMSARYIEYMDVDSANSDILLMQSNTYTPLVTETRIFDFSTAKIVKPSSKKLINIEIQSYLPSTPDNIQTVRITLVLQNEQWYLDSGTY